MQCRVCGEIKPEFEFAWRDKAADVRRKDCKVCSRKYHNDYYANTPKRKQAVRTRHEHTSTENLAWCRAQLATGCVDCGITDVRVLEFDHLPGFDKRDGVMKLARYGASRATLQTEINKCEVRCRNCHMIVTYERGEWDYANTGL